MATVAEVIERVSLLRSKIAIRKQLALHLRTMYLGSDASAAESRIHRDDSGVVPEEHLKTFVATDIDHALQQDEAELQQWEQLLVIDPTEQVKKEKSHGGARARRDQPGVDEG